MVVANKLSNDYRGIVYTFRRITMNGEEKKCETYERYYRRGNNYCRGRRPGSVSFRKFRIKNINVCVEKNKKIM